MAQSVELTLDAAAEAALVAQWDRLAAVGPNGRIGYRLGCIGYNVNETSLCSSGVKAATIHQQLCAF